MVHVVEENIQVLSSLFTTDLILLMKKHYKTPQENLKGTSGELVFYRDFDVIPASLY